MTQMHGIRARPSARVEVELLALLKSSQDGVELAMREEGPSSQQRVRTMASHLLEALQQLGRDGPCAEFVDCGRASEAYGQLSASPNLSLARAAH